MPLGSTPTPLFTPWPPPVFFPQVHNHWVDYIYTEGGQFRTVEAATVEGAPGGSDHKPIFAVVMLLG